MATRRKTKRIIVLAVAITVIGLLILWLDPFRTTVYVFVEALDDAGKVDESASITLRINGKPWRSLIHGDEIVTLHLRPGHYTFSCSAQHYVACSEELDITRGGDEAYVTCELHSNR